MIEIGGMSREEQAAAKIEVQILASLNHPNVIGYSQSNVCWVLCFQQSVSHSLVPQSLVMIGPLTGITTAFCTTTGSIS